MIPSSTGRRQSELRLESTSQSDKRATMRALVQHTYGPPEVLRLATVPIPQPGPGQVRVRVHASSVNARDWHIMRGEPQVARLLDRSVFSFRAPRTTVRGTDFAGVVDSVGPDVTGWKPGDRIFGEAEAAWAEYAVADTGRTAEIPRELPFELAAAMPLAGTTAMTCLTAGQASVGDRLLLIGASGGVGTFALQMARAKGLHITAVCSARNAEQARALGAHSVIDYAAEDFCARTDRYDLVVDLVGNRPVGALRQMVRPAGTLVLSGGGVPGTGRIIGPIGLLAKAQLAARRPGPGIVTPQARPSTDDLEQLAAMVTSDQVVPAIDRTFDFEDGADAVRYVETQHGRGKVIITMPTG